MKRGFPLHPLFLAVFPVVFLYARNLTGEVSPRDLVVPLLLSVATTFVVALVFWWRFRDIHRAGIATSIVVVLVFSFGHVEHEVDPVGLGNTEGLLLFESCLLLVAGIVALVRFKDGIHKTTRVLNPVAIFLCAINVFPIVRFEMGTTQGRLETATPAILRTQSPGGTDRDIYYLIFDRYAADRTLRDMYDFDNGDFYGWLETAGFYVAPDSLANYPKTIHSLASSLNMTYLDDLAAEVGRDSGDWQPLTDALGGFRIASSLQRIGYRYYHIGSWWPGTGTDSTADEDFTFDSPIEFRDILFDSTMVPALGTWLGIRDRQSFELRQYRRVRFQFDALDQISGDPAPTFTFAHFLVPHPPYIVDADGSFVPPEEAAKKDRDEAYLDQLAFTNHEIEQVVGDLLSGPAAEDPIIVIQSDEGPHPIALEQDEDAFVWTDATDAELGMKLRILNAYFLPGLEDPGLYPTISPVNTFRLIFSRYFDADLPLLPDRTFVFERKAYPYRFTDVTERLRP
jgi:sulfatase-like protein